MRCATRLPLALSLSLALLGCRSPAPERDPSAAITPLTLPSVSLYQAGERGERLTAGAPIVLHFWATWCAPCRRELPALIDACRATGIRLVAVTDEAWSEVRAFFGDRPVPASIARDPAALLSRTLGLRALPETYLVDRDLIARRRIVGVADWRDPGVRSWLRSWVTPDGT